MEYYILSKILYLEMSLKQGYSQQCRALCMSGEGFSLSKHQKGWISAEWMISESNNGDATFHLWEQWSTQKDFETYMKTPECTAGSNFERSVKLFAVGEIRMVWGNLNVE